MTIRRSAAIVAVVMLAGLAAGAAAGAQTPPPPAPLTLSPPADAPFQVQVVADFESPWAMTFLPDGRMLITEKAGTLLPRLRGRPAAQDASAAFRPCRARDRAA